MIFKKGWGKEPTWECLHVHKKARKIFSFHVDDIALVGKKQNMRPTWQIQHQEIDLEDPTPVIDQVYSECTQTEAKVDHAEKSVERYCELAKKMFLLFSR